MPPQLASGRAIERVTTICRMGPERLGHPARAARRSSARYSARVVLAPSVAVQVSPDRCTRAR